MKQSIVPEDSCLQYSRQRTALEAARKSQEEAVSSRPNFSSLSLTTPCSQLHATRVKSIFLANMSHEMRTPFAYATCSSFPAGIDKQQCLLWSSRLAMGYRVDSVRIALFSPFLISMLTSQLHREQRELGASRK
jgi:signal transduction histidine kinase